MKLRLPVKSVVTICVLALIIFSLRFCMLPDTVEMIRALSPGWRWVAISTRTIYQSTFSSPTRAVVLRPSGLAHLWTADRVVFELDEEGIGGSDEGVLALRWLNPNTLQITVSDHVKKIYKKDTHYQDIAIEYDVVAPDPRYQGR